MRRLRLARVAVLLAMLAAAADASADDGFLAETGFDFWGSDDAQRASGSLRWYPNVGQTWLAQFGVRLTGERLQFPGVDVTAASVGGFVGVSHAVGRIWPTV